nr:hypothetical protein [uncultured Bacillus sp.]
MMLKNQWIYNIAMILLSWSSLSFIGKNNIKRFLPASVLIVIFEAINAIIGKKRKWWIFYNKPKSYISGEFPFNIGPFFLSSIWVLKKGYGNIKKFLILNAIVDAFFTTIYITVLEKLKIVRLARINNFQFFLYFFYKAFFLYGFQYIIEKKGNSINRC